MSLTLIVLQLLLMIKAHFTTTTTTIDKINLCYSRRRHDPRLHGLQPRHPGHRALLQPQEQQRELGRLEQAVVDAIQRTGVRNIRNSRIEKQFTHFLPAQYCFRYSCRTNMSKRRSHQSYRKLENSFLRPIAIIIIMLARLLTSTACSGCPKLIKSIKLSFQSNKERTL